MGPGHFGVALAAKPLAPKAPLWTLLAAGEALDLLCFGFMAAGLEKAAVTQADFTHGVQVLVPGYIPWSHGLGMSLVWSALAAGLAWLLSRDRRLSAVIGLVVFSHWLLDFIVHPALPVFLADGPQISLRLWMSGPGFIASIFLDVGLLIGGIIVYAIWRRKE